jgi:hypothetical protein
MDVWGWLRGLILTKTEPAPDTNPWDPTAPVAAQPGANPWKTPKAVTTPVKEASPWKAPQGIGKNWILHKLSLVVIVLNIGVGATFYSNNTVFNAALFLYLGVSTIILGHYYSLTR